MGRQLLEKLKFSEQSFYGNYSALDSHTKNVISQEVANLSRWLPISVGRAYIYISKQSYQALHGERYFQFFKRCEIYQALQGERYFQLSRGLKSEDQLLHSFTC